MGLFDTVKITRPSRSAFRLSYNHYTTMRIGQAIPSMAKLGIPGDTWTFGQVAQVELQPLASPFKGELWLESCAFFVPLDILKASGEDKFSDMLSKVTDTQEPIPNMPKWSLAATTDSDGKLVDTHINKLWDKFGFPTNLTAISDIVKPMAYLQRAYNMIYNEWIRDENQDLEVSLDNNDLLTVCYKKDYFSSAFDDPQKGQTPPTIPISGTASAKWSNDVLNAVVGLLVNVREVRSALSQGQGKKIAANTEVKESVTSSDTVSSVGNATTSITSSSGAQDSSLGLKVNQALLDLLNNNTLDMSQMITFTIDDLRLCNKLQVWLERCQVAGTRTKEFLLANYGIAPSDETLQRPVFLGRLRTPVSVSSSLSSVEAQVTHSGQTVTIPQGNKVGNGTASQSVLFKKWIVKEPGIFLVISFLRPKASYSQGINREWILNNIYDYPNPIFENLGQQMIYNAEIYVSGTEATDTAKFGYQDNYVHLKTSQDITTSELRAGQNLSSWSIHRNFAQTPTLSSNFMHVSPSDYDYLFAVANQPHAVVTFNNVIKSVRPFHKFSRPTL